MRVVVADTFAKCKAEGRAALIPFVTGGYPTLPLSEAILVALAAGGADIIEIGVPFSDPLADGATVQATSQRALEQGTTLQDCFDIARAAREKHGVEIPIVLMGYSNPFYQFGLDRLAETAVDVRGRRLHHPRFAVGRERRIRRAAPEAGPRSDLTGRADHYRVADCVI